MHTIAVEHKYMMPYKFTTNTKVYAVGSGHRKGLEPENTIFLYLVHIMS